MRPCVYPLTRCVVPHRRVVHPIVALLMALLTVHCTRWTRQDVAPAKLIAEKHPTRVRVQRADGSRVVLSDPAVVGDSIVGAQGYGRKAMAVTDVTSVALWKFDLGRTIVLALVGVGVPYIGLVIFYSSWSDT